jgi:hypothetical protein
MNVTRIAVSGERAAGSSVLEAAVGKTDRGDVAATFRR